MQVIVIILVVAAVGCFFLLGARRSAAGEAKAPTPVATASGAAAPSSSVDQVVLKDGGIVRGRVLKHEPGTFVTIETPEGAQRTIAWDRVSEVIVGPPKKSR